MMWLYWRFVYPRHMRLIHRFGRHQWKVIGPVLGGEGDTRNHIMWDHCDWCGEDRRFRYFAGPNFPTMAALLEAYNLEPPNLV